MAVHHGPAYLFTTDSAPVPSDGGDSWPDYIPWHPSHGFTGYALRLTGTLRPAFGLGSPLQTDSPLHSPLSYPGLPDGFARDNRHAATHLSRRIQMIAFRHITFIEVQIPNSPFSSRIYNFLAIFHNLKTMLHCYRTAFYPYFCMITMQPGVRFYRRFCACTVTVAEPLGRIIFHGIAAMGSPATLCG